MEATEVDETVGGKEKVGDDRSNGVELANQTTTESNGKGEKIAATRFVVYAKTFAKISNTWEKFIVA